MVSENVLLSSIWFTKQSWPATGAATDSAFSDNNGGPMSALTLGASVDPAAYVPSLAPAYPAQESQYTGCRQHQYIMMNVVPPLGQALQMFSYFLHNMYGKNWFYILLKCVI